MEQSKRTEEEEEEEEDEQWGKDSRAGCRASKEAQWIGKAMLTIRRKKYEPAAPPTRVGKKQQKQKGPEAAARLPVVTPATKCKLRLLKLDRVKDYLLMEEEFVAGQERLKPQEDKNEEDWFKVDDLRGSPMSVGIISCSSHM